MSRFYNNINTQGIDHCWNMHLQYVYVPDSFTKGKFSSFIFQENNKTEIKFNQFMIFELQYENKARVWHTDLYCRELWAGFKVKGNWRWKGVTILSQNKILMDEKMCFLILLVSNTNEMDIFFPSFHIKILVNSF